MAGHAQERDRGHDHRSNGSTVQAAGAELAQQGTEDLRRLSSFLGSTPVAPAILDDASALPQGDRRARPAFAGGAVCGERNLVDTPPYPPMPSPTGVAARECLPRRTATISARIEIAISSGVIAPRSSPAGALSLTRRSAGTPCSASFAFSASAFLWLPTNARYSVSTANAASNAASSPRPCVETTTYRSPASSTGNA